MKLLEIRFHRERAAGRRFSRSLLLGGPLLVGALGTVPSAFGATITNGTYISESAYDSGIPYSYATPGGFDYTNGILSQTNTVSDPASPYASATSAASLASNQLNMSLTGSFTYTSGVAEMWDTLTLGNLPSGPSVTANTVVGTLNMTVNASVGTATYGVSAYSSYGLNLFSTATFAPSAGGDCGWAGGMNCGGAVNSSGLGSTLFSPGTYHFSVPITLGSLSSGQIAYIAEISATNYSDPSLSAPLTIDPSITLTGLYSGVTVSSASGYNYTTPVPLPSNAWLLGTGLVFVTGMARRRRRWSRAG